MDLDFGARPSVAEDEEELLELEDALELEEEPDELELEDVLIDERNNCVDKEEDDAAEEDRDHGALSEEEEEAEEEALTRSSAGMGSCQGLKDCGKLPRNEKTWLVPSPTQLAS